MNKTAKIHYRANITLSQKVTNEKATEESIFEIADFLKEATAEDINKHLNTNCPSGMSFETTIEVIGVEIVEEKS